MGAFDQIDMGALLADGAGTLRELDKVECESMSTFVRRAWPQIEPFTKYKHNWHIDAMCEHLEAVSYGELRRVIFNVPPGSSKSTICSVMLPAWEWGPRNLPGLRYIGTSYSERYAIRDNNKTRNLITSPWYQERWGEQFRLIKAGYKKIENSLYGFREAIPFKSLTAGRADRLVIDDPHSTESAESDAERETTIRIFLESVPTRLNDPEKSAIIIVMQRLHEEDVTGVALSRELGYEHVMIPMRYDPARHFVTRWFEDPRTEPGELMFPDRFPEFVVREYENTMGPYAASGQLQQAPVPRGGGIFKWEWWNLWGNPDDSEDERFKTFPPMDYVVASLDSAYTEKEENDYSALTIWGVFRESPGATVQPSHPLSQVLGLPKQSITQQHAYGSSRIMLMHGWQARLPLHELIDRTAKTCKRFRVNKLLIEAKASGISVAQEMRRLHSGNGWDVQLIDPGRADKVARAYSVQAIFSDGMVYAPDRDWADMIKSQMATFPKSSHDDLTDSSCMAIRYLRDIGLVVHAAEADRELQSQMAYKPAAFRPLYPV